MLQGVSKQNIILQKYTYLGGTGVLIRGTFRGHVRNGRILLYLHSLYLSVRLCLRFTGVWWLCALLPSQDWAKRYHLTVSFGLQAWGTLLYGVCQVKHLLKTINTQCALKLRCILVMIHKAS